MRKLALGITFVVLLVGLVGIVSAQEPATDMEEMPDATAQMVDVHGRAVGEAQLMRTEDGQVHVDLQLNGFDPVAGDHAFAIMTIGSCEGANFASAGIPAVSLPNVQFYADGSADYSRTVDYVQFDTLFDDNGSALVVYADTDQNESDRIACGVVSATEAMDDAGMVAEEPVDEVAEPTEAEEPVAEDEMAGEDMAATDVVSATAQIKNTGNIVAGTVNLRQTEDGQVEVSLQVDGFQPVPGDHAFAIMTIGSCEAPTFASAGIPAVSLPNVQFYANGSADYSQTVDYVQFDTLFDDNGSALVIYADTDQDESDRIACGVITPAQ